MFIKEADLKHTFKEKFSDFLNTTFFGQLILWIIGLLMVIIFPILLIFGLTWENVIEKYWYQWTGRQRGNFHPEDKNPYNDLPIKVDFVYIFLADREFQKLEQKLDVLYEDIEQLEIGQIKTEPVISELKDKYFDFNTFVFDDKLFVQEVKLPGFKTDIGFIDCRDLTYQTIKALDSYPTIKFEDHGDVLEIILRQPKMKKLISVYKNATDNKL